MCLSAPIVHGRYSSRVVGVAQTARVVLKCGPGQVQRFWARGGPLRTMSNENLIADTATRILSDLADPQTVNRAAGDDWKTPAWAALEDAGLTLAWVPEVLGGAGGDMADGFAVLRQAGRFAAAVPLAETLLAGWLLSRAGI